MSSGFRFPIYQFKFHLPKAGGGTSHPPATRAGPQGGVKVLRRTKELENAREVCYVLYSLVLSCMFIKWLWVKAFFWGGGSDEGESAVW